MIQYLVAVFGFAAIMVSIAQPADAPRQETAEQVYQRQINTLMQNWDLYQACLVDNARDVCINVAANQPSHVREYEIVR